MKKNLQMFTLLMIIFFTGGCVKDVIVSEVLQIPEYASIYTRYNLWYEDPEKMDTENFQKGNILPFGTEVYIKSASTGKIVFEEVKSGTIFTIHFDMKYRMMTVDEYVRELFSTKNFDDLTIGISNVNIEKIRRGIVEPGMSKKEVELAFGPPCAYRTRSKDLNTWCYWVDYLIGKRIVFTNNIVTDIIVLSSEKYDKELESQNIGNADNIETDSAVKENIK